MDTGNSRRVLSFSIDNILSKESSTASAINKQKYTPYADDRTCKVHSVADDKCVTLHSVTCVDVDDSIAKRLGQCTSFSDDSGDDDATADNDTMTSPLKSRDTESSSTSSSTNSSPDDIHRQSRESGFKCKSKKKTRTVFSRQQVFYLEAAFDAKRYLSSAERSEIATSLHLSETQVKVWFQNRRNKWKAQLNGDEKGSPQDNAPIFMPPFLCNSVAAAAVAHAHRVPSGLPPLSMFRQQVFY